MRSETHRVKLNIEKSMSKKLATEKSYFPPKTESYPFHFGLTDKVSY